MSTKSREHHWWPVVLQKYWTDKHEYLSWIEADGKIFKKKAKNRKIAYKSHGHTIFLGSDWESNFEPDFSAADDRVPMVIEDILKLRPLGKTPAEFLCLIRLIFKSDRHLRDMCKFYQLNEKIHRSLLMILYSIIIRSPGSRFRYENYPTEFGMPPDEDTGKGNMFQNYRIAKNLCEKGLITNQYFILIHSSIKKFIFGDGCLDWASGELIANRIKGRMLVPLTPHLCVYFCTPRYMLRSPNCASLHAPPWMVDWINDIMQIYSRDKLFFLGKPPVLNYSFSRRQYLEHEGRSDGLIDMLDEIAGNNRTSLFGFRL